MFVALLASVSLVGTASAVEPKKQTSAAKAVAAKAKPKKAVARKIDPSRPPASARPIYESIVIDATSGSVLHQVNADTPAYPASLTKMMTLYMLFDAMKKGKVHLDTPMKVSQKASTQDPSKLDLAPGSTIAVEQAIYAIVTKSANDVAMVIAEHIGGSEDRFCQMMTQRARQIGMTRTTFKNPNGLPNKGQISTARDMAILGRRLMLDFPEQFSYFAKTEFPYRGVMVKGHNHFMEHYDGADGLKTGYTFASGFNLAASARRGNQRLITVVFGGASAKMRDDHTAELMDAGFAAMRNPQAVQMAQSVDHFPGAPVTQVAAIQPAPAQLSAAATEQTDEDAIAALLEPVVPAGDTDDPNAAVAPPLAQTAALVPEPSFGKQSAKATAAVRAANQKASAMPVPTPSPNASWGIQLGAYSNRLLAQNQADAAVRQISDTFATVSARIVPVKLKANNKTVFRAQVVGLTRQETTKACAIAAKLAAAGCKAVAPDGQKTVASR